MATVTQAQDKAGKYMKYNTKSKMNYILHYVHNPEKTDQGFMQLDLKVIGIKEKIMDIQVLVFKN